MIRSVSRETLVSAVSRETVWFFIDPVRASLLNNNNFSAGFVSVCLLLVL